jgi:hypothetical protein
MAPWPNSLTRTNPSSVGGTASKTVGTVVRAKLSGVNRRRPGRACKKTDFIVTLDHEGGKGYARKDNKFAVFGKDGNMIDSPRALGASAMTPNKDYRN